MGEWQNRPLDSVYPAVFIDCIHVKIGAAGELLRPPRESLVRDPSDLTDAQWALIEPLLPEPNMDGRRGMHPGPGKSSTRSRTWCNPGVRGGTCPLTCRRGRRCSGTSPSGKQPVTNTLLATLRVKAQVQRGRQPSCGIRRLWSRPGRRRAAGHRSVDVRCPVTPARRAAMADLSNYMITCADLGYQIRARDRDVQPGLVQGAVPLA
jgi:transposase